MAGAPPGPRPGPNGRSRGPPQGEIWGGPLYVSARDHGSLHCAAPRHRDPAIPRRVILPGTAHGTTPRIIRAATPRHPGIAGRRHRTDPPTASPSYMPRMLIRSIPRRRRFSAGIAPFPTHSAPHAKSRSGPDQTAERAPPRPPSEAMHLLNNSPSRDGFPAREPRGLDSTRPGDRRALNWNILPIIRLGRIGTPALSHSKSYGCCYGFAAMPPRARPAMPV
jgi:hypothetical protein